METSQLHRLADTRRAELSQERADRATLQAQLGRARRATSSRGDLTIGGRASAWLGYRMIGLGCRLARPALVAGAQPGL